MRILNFGSLNIDAVYRVDHISAPGETIASKSFQTFAGGKGANQSVALARAGADVAHGGQVGEDGRWLVEKLRQAGVDVTHTRINPDIATGHAIIQVDDSGQNSIVLFGGANQQITRVQVDAAFSAFVAGSILLLQNEVNDAAYLIKQGHARGMKVCLNPAPFDAGVLKYPLDRVDTIIVNETEAAGLAGDTSGGGGGGGGGGASGGEERVLDKLTKKLPKTEIVLTRGSQGVLYGRGEKRLSVPAVQVEAVDTTAAGDTFIGYYLAGRAAGRDVQQCLQTACRAAALCVTKPGASDSIPTTQQVEAFSHG